MLLEFLFSIILVDILIDYNFNTSLRCRVYYLYFIFIYITAIRCISSVTVLMLNSVWWIEVFNTTWEITEN